MQQNNNTNNEQPQWMNHNQHLIYKLFFRTKKKQYLGNSREEQIQCHHESHSQTNLNSKWNEKKLTLSNFRLQSTIFFPLKKRENFPIFNYPPKKNEKEKLIPNSNWLEAVPHISIFLIIKMWCSVNKKKKKEFIF